MKYQPISKLLDRLGYVDPCPKRGKHNKAAIKLRRAAIEALNLEQYRVGTATEWDKDGYIKVPVYEYEGIRYSRA